MIFQKRSGTTRLTRRHTPEDLNLQQRHRYENLKCRKYLGPPSHTLRSEEVGKGGSKREAQDLRLVSV
jgi:hypothetical protein